MLMTSKKVGASMTVAEAMAALGVSHTKLTKMLHTGELHATPDPLDKRFKRIARAEVEELLARTREARGEE